jgi:hypothetical protein
MFTTLSDTTISYAGKYPSIISVVMTCVFGLQACATLGKKIIDRAANIDIMRFKAGYLPYDVPKKLKGKCPASPFSLPSAA